jgi:hypothetical protein
MDGSDGHTKMMNTMPTITTQKSARRAERFRRRRFSCELVSDRLLCGFEREFYGIMRQMGRVQGSWISKANGIDLRYQSRNHRAYLSPGIDSLEV